MAVAVHKTSESRRLADHASIQKATATDGKRLTAISLAATAALAVTTFAFTRARMAMPEGQLTTNPIISCDPTVISGVSLQSPFSFSVLAATRRE
ncbi:hypothetical protein FAZ69_15590 [Trinickia terrae]|uniref:Uncharacterized protein n=1 Tax=Trinickia terrae TaxID=2571161 RepID=A0A4U1I3D9_9BURK|nr:hypothetical protein [Trinickia terrae]TKC87712.1 hypothetical protein FAZ69_15590 [Trinickia terrae]